MSPIKEFIVGLLGLAKDGLKFIEDHWEILQGIFWMLVAVIGVTGLGRWLKGNWLAWRSRARLRDYLNGELSYLRGVSSLVENVPIDFGADGDYVSLVLVEQRYGNIFGAKRAISVQEVLGAENPVIVVSGPGYGKTTLLRHMQYQLLSKHADGVRLQKHAIPIFFEAKSISTNRPPDLVELIAEKVNTLEESAERFAALGIKKGWFTIFIDGIDEIDTSVHEFVANVTRLATFNPKCHFVLASRPVSYDLEYLTHHAVRPFTEIAISPLSHERKLAIIHKYAKSEEDAAKIEALINEHPFLREITRVTINLILLVALVRESGSIRSRADFYKHASRKLLDDIPRQRKSKDLQYSLQQKEELLEQVSFAVLVNSATFDGETVEGCDCGEDAPTDVFDEIRRTSGLIKLAALGEYSFPHRTFGEYYAAKYIVDNYTAIPNDAWSCIFAVEASEVIAFVANLLPDIDALIDEIMRLSQQRTRLLATCLANCQSVSVGKQMEAEGVILAALKDSPEVQVQSSAARYVLSLVHLFPRPEGFTTLYCDLVNRVKSPQVYAAGLEKVDEVQTQALQLLVHTASREIVPELIELFHDDDTDTYVKFKAGELLAALSTEELLQELVEAYSNNDDVDVRRFIVQAIVRTKSEMALKVLETAYIHDSDAVIRALALKGHEQIQEKLYLDEATIIISTSGPKSVKSAIPGCDLAPASLLSVAADKSSPFRLDAFFRLRLGCPSKHESELTGIACDSEENEFFRCEAVRLLGTQPGDAYGEGLVRVFRTTRLSDPEVGAGARGCAIEYLAHRKETALVFSCLPGLSIAKCISSEQCKIVWAIYEVVRTSQELGVNDLNLIRQICNECEGDENPRVQHWRDRILDKLGAVPATTTSEQQG